MSVLLYELDLVYENKLCSYCKIEYYMEILLDSDINFDGIIHTNNNTRALLMRRVLINKGKKMGTY